MPLFFVLLGLSWANYCFDKHLRNGFPDQFERIDFAVLGDIEGLVTQRNGNYTFDFRIQQIDAELPRHLSGAKLKLSCYRCPLKIKTNQTWRFTLRVKRPHGYASWGAFDYEKYLFRNEVVAKGYVRLKGQNNLISSHQSSWTNWRVVLRDSLTSKSKDSVGLDMILALAIGDKSGFSNQQRQVFQDTGSSHLMAISGLHVGLVFLFVSTLFRILLWPIARVFDIVPRSIIVLFPALVSAIVYSALAGFAVSTQRALVMLVVYVTCRLFAREASLIKILLIAMTVLLLADPFSVLDTGFWLSCGAVLVIALVSQGHLLRDFFSSSSGRAVPLEKTSLLKLQPMLWLGMLPLTASLFGQVSLISPLVNLVLVPLFCVVLVPLTLVGVCIDAVGLELVSIWWFSKLSGAFDHVYLALEWLSNLSFASRYITSLVWWQLCLFAFAVVTYLFRPRVSILLWLGFTLSIFINTSPSLESDELQITLLDVGQGLAMIIETENNVIVYDTGPKYSTGFTAAGAVLLPYLRHRGVQRIDTLIISHADNDHIGGYQTVIDAIDVSEVFTSRVDKIAIAKACTAGDTWLADQTKITVLSPEQDTPQGSNNRSCVLMLEHFGTRILLSGDIEKQVERYLVAQHQDQLAADILLVPHQGSKTSSTENFLQAVAPELAMLAAGYKNHYGHPHASVVARYQAHDVDLYSTIDSGSVLLKINTNGWQIVEYRQAHKRFWHYQKVPK